MEQDVFGQISSKVIGKSVSALGFYFFFYILDL